MKYKDPVYITTIDECTGGDEILPYTDRITLESESVNEEEALRLLDRGLEICRRAGL